MRLPIPLVMLYHVAKRDSAAFAAGWANGLARWKGAQHASDSEIPGNAFPAGSVASAASEAAVAYMRELRATAS